MALSSPPAARQRRGRPPRGERAMTSAEKSKAHRARVKARLARLESLLRENGDGKPA